MNKERAGSVTGIGLEITPTCREGQGPSRPALLPSAERRTSEEQVRTRWDETHFLQPVGPSLSVCGQETSERQIPFLFLSKVPPGRPFCVFLIKADKREEKHLWLHFSPHFSSPGIILNKHFIFHLLSFISNFTVPDLSLLFESQTVPKAQYFSGK